MKNRMLWGIVLFLSIPILLGGRLMLDTGWKIIEGCRAAHWPHTVGIVQSVESKDNSDSDSNSREILIRYTYTVDGRDYEGSTVHPTYRSSSFEEAHQGLEHVLRSEKKVRVYYRSDSPNRSTLSVGFYSSSLARFFMGALFATSGLVALLTLWFALAGNSNYASGVTVVEEPTHA